MNEVLFLNHDTLNVIAVFCYPCRRITRYDISSGTWKALDGGLDNTVYCMMIASNPANIFVGTSDAARETLTNPHKRARCAELTCPFIS